MGEEYYSRKGAKPESQNYECGGVIVRTIWQDQVRLILNFEISLCVSLRSSAPLR
jgi:hypothetical protein